MRPVNLVRVVRETGSFRVALWAGWLVLAMPVARVLLTHPAPFFLRALPAPRWHFVTVHAGMLCLSSLPFAALFAVGEGVPSAIARALGSSACAALYVGGLRTLPERGAAAGILLLIAGGAPTVALAVAAPIALAIGVGGAWDRAPVVRATTAARPGETIRSAIAGPPALALAIAHAQALLRVERAALQRSLLAVFVGGAALALAAKNNAVHDIARLCELAVLVGALPLGIACGGLAGPVIEAERRIRWLLDVTSTQPKTRARAATFVTAIVGLLAGFAFGSAAALLSDRAAASARVAVVLVGMGAGTAMGMLAAAWARRANRPLGVDGSSLVAAMVGTVLGTMLLAHLMGAWALLPLAALAMQLGRSSVQSIHRAEGASHRAQGVSR